MIGHLKTELWEMQTLRWQSWQSFGVLGWSFMAGCLLQKTRLTQHPIPSGKWTRWNSTKHQFCLSRAAPEVIREERFYPQFVRTVGKFMKTESLTPVLVITLSLQWFMGLLAVYALIGLAKWAEPAFYVFHEPIGHPGLLTPGALAYRTVYAELRHPAIFFRYIHPHTSSDPVSSL